jgi:octaprenyl-diphosphate synthase
MTVELKDFIKTLDGDLKRVEAEMHATLSSDVRLVDKVVRYIVRHKGKNLRPILTLLSARLFGNPSDRTIKSAVMVELLHTATLVHDDVVDDAKMRRGHLSVNAVWRNKVSVLVGDYLLATSLAEILDLRDLQVLDILAIVARRMSRGELLQIAKARKLDITEEVYLDMIGDKTAALMGACCELAAVTLGRGDADREKMREFGEKVGLAFQIRDDILDFEGRRAVLGKPTMGDVKERKITLPLIHALRSCQDGRSRRIINMIRRGLKPEERKTVLGFIHEYDGIKYAARIAEKIKSRALDHLRDFPESPARRALEDFAEFSVRRTK